MSEIFLSFFHSAPHLSRVELHRGHVREDAVLDGVEGARRVLFVLPERRLPAARDGAVRFGDVREDDRHALDLGSKRVLQCHFNSSL